MGEGGAMSDEYTPTTAQMREYFALGPYQPWASAPMSDDEREAMFNRWLASIQDQNGAETRQPECRVVVGASVVFTSPDRAAAERYMVVTSGEGSE